LALGGGLALGLAPDAGLGPFKFHLLSLIKYEKLKNQIHSLWFGLNEWDHFLAQSI